LGLGAGVVFALLGSVQVATAQEAPSAQPAPGGGDTAMSEARQRYERGLQLFNEANYDAARVEFERAYHLAPSYKILYNIGLSYEQLGDYVQAQTTLQRYLEQGGSEISETRRAEVAKELAQIQPRVARVTIHTNVDRAEVLVDDACSVDANSGNVNCGALEGAQRTILMNPGRRRVTLRHDGYLPEMSLITVAGSDKLDITVELKPLPKFVEKKSNPWLLPMWIGWGVTGAGLITATVTGILAKNARDDQNAAVARFGESRDDIDHLKDKTHNLALVTDVVLIGSGVTALISGYLTSRAISWKGGEEQQPSTQVGVGFGRLSVSGRF